MYFFGGGGTLGIETMVSRMLGQYLPFQPGIYFLSVVEILCHHLLLHVFLTLHLRHSVGSLKSPMRRR